MLERYRQCVRAPGRACACACVVVRVRARAPYAGELRAGPLSTTGRVRVCPVCARVPPLLVVGAYPKTASAVWVSSERPLNSPSILSCTLNILDWIRRGKPPPPVAFSSLGKEETYSRQ